MFQAVQPSNRLIATDSPVRKYLVRQKAVDRFFYEPMADKPGQTPSSVKNSDTSCMQLSHMASSRTLSTMDTQRVKKIRVKVLEQGPLKSLTGDLKRAEEDRLISYLAQRTQNERSKFHNQNGQNGRSIGSESSSDDEGMGSGESSASSPEKTNTMNSDSVKQKSKIISKIQSYF